MNKQNNNCECSCDYTVVSGNSLDVDVNYCESEIRADIVVSEYSSVRLWGRIVNCDGKPIANALIKLLQVECHANKEYYKGIAHTVSDCDGFYQFELCACAEKVDSSCYKILVSKAAYGPERILPVTGGNCNVCDPCEENGFDPCKEYPPIVTKPCEVGNGGHCCEPEQPCSYNYYPKQKY